MLYKRVLSGLLFLPIFYLFTWKLPPIYFLGLVMGAAILGQHEFYRMAQARGIRPAAVLGSVLGALVVLDAYRPLAPAAGAVLLAACLLAIMVVRLFSRRPVEGAIEDVSATFLGIVYVALLFAFQVSIRMGSNRRATSSRFQRGSRVVMASMQSV